MNHPIVKIVQDTGCQSYVVGCPETRQALLVDPKVGRKETIRDVCARFGLTPVAVVDTHTHADHLSDSVAFLNDGLTLYMGARTACRRDLKRVKKDDAVAVGSLEFRVAEVPGHTDDSIALIGHGVAIAGDTLLVGGLARADFLGSDPAVLWESVRDVFLALPDETVVLPGHDYRDLPFTTIAAEKAANPALRFASGPEYAESVGAVPGAGNTPEVDAMLAANLEETPDLPDSPRAVVACCGSGEAGGMAPREAEESPAELADRREEFCSRGA
ncbi:MAG: MBL fold metallo-hydrolase, partial [Planctomycetota bacterium JB042]